MCVAPARAVSAVSGKLDLVSRRAIPETFFTVWTNVFERGRLRAGETALFHGGSSGIGTTAIQLAAARGARVLATAGSDEKCRACEDLGAEQAINYRTADFVEAVHELTDGQGVDLILDIVGGSYVGRNLEALATRRPSGADRLHERRVDGASICGASWRRRLTITGSTLRPRTSAEKGRSPRPCDARSGRCSIGATSRRSIYRTFPLHEAAEAHRLMESSEHIGKIVLVVEDILARRASRVIVQPRSRCLAVRP